MAQGMRTFAIGLTFLAFAAFAASAGADAKKVLRAQTIALGATQHSRAASRSFYDVVRMGTHTTPGHTTTLDVIEDADRGHQQVLASYAGNGPRGTTSKSVHSATLNGRTFSEYSVSESGVGGPEASRSGVWKSHEKRLGGLVSIHTKTDLMTFHRVDAPPKTFVNANRKTLRLLGIPVMYLGKNMSEEQIKHLAQIGP